MNWKLSEKNLSEDELTMLTNKYMVQVLIDAHLFQCSTSFTSLSRTSVIVSTGLGVLDPVTRVTNRYCWCTGLIRNQISYNSVNFFMSSRDKFLYAVPLFMGKISFQSMCEPVNKMVSFQDYVSVNAVLFNYSFLALLAKG